MTIDVGPRDLKWAREMAAEAANAFRRWGHQAVVPHPTSDLLEVIRILTEAETEQEADLKEQVANMRRELAKANRQRAAAEARLSKQKRALENAESAAKTNGELAERLDEELRQVTKAANALEAQCHILQKQVDTLSVSTEEDMES